MKKYITTLGIIGFFVVIVVAISWFIFPDWQKVPQGRVLLIVTALGGVITFLVGLKDVHEFINNRDKKKAKKKENAELKELFLPNLAQGTVVESAENITIHNIYSSKDGEDKPDNIKILHNLPQPTYGEFIGREKEFQQVIGILKPYPQSQYPVVTIDGIGGIGKTTLALEVAHYFINRKTEIKQDELFSAIIWTSAKKFFLTADGILPRNQAVDTLFDIYKTILMVFGNPIDFITTFSSYSSSNQSEFIRRLLTKQRTLLIIDNLETVDDINVISFIKEIPAPTKVIVTTRHRIDVAYPIRLLGLQWGDAKNLIILESKKNNVNLSDDEIKQLFDYTGGVPLAVGWSIAKMGFGYGIESVLRELGNATGDICEFCFENSLKIIKNKNSFRLLVALNLFETNASREELGNISNLSIVDRDEALIQLEKLSLVNNDGEKYSLLPLTKVFINNERLKYKHLDNELRQRWEKEILNIKVSDLISEANMDIGKSCSTTGLKIPIGRNQAGEIVFLTLDNYNVNLLIGGLTGSGKSMLLNIIIYNLCLLYSPSELCLFLVDPKGGEFLPLINKINRVETTLIGDDKYYFLEMLDQIHGELNRRFTLFRETEARDIGDYRNKTGRPLPRIVILIDEFILLLDRDDWITELIMKRILDLVKRSRAGGIHFVLATQNYESTINLSPILAQISNRIALRCDERLSERILGEGNTEASYISRPGQAIFNNSFERIKNILFQIAYITQEDVISFSNVFDNLTIGKSGTEGRIIIKDRLGSIETNYWNDYLLSLPENTNSTEDVEVVLGESLSSDHPYSVTLSSESGNNILIIGNEEKKATGILSSIVISLSTYYKAQSIIVYYLDLTYKENLYSTASTLSHSLPLTLRLCGRSDVEIVLKEIYNNISNQSMIKSQKIFIIIEGLHNLIEDINNMETLDSEMDTSYSNIFKTLLSRKYAGQIHTVVWCDSLYKFRYLFKENFRDVVESFRYRLAVSNLTEEENLTLFDRRKIDIYQGRAFLASLYFDRKPWMFTPFTPPSPEWIVKFGNMLRERSEK